MKKFLELITQNPELKAKVEALDKDPKAVPADYIALAKEYGHELTEEAFVRVPAGELSDDELEAVAGGGSCACPFAGGGSSDEYCKTCACVIGGGGEFKDGTCRCWCAVHGGGEDRPW